MLKVPDLLMTLGSIDCPLGWGGGGGWGVDIKGP